MKNEEQLLKSEDFLAASSSLISPHKIYQSGDNNQLQQRFVSGSSNPNRQWKTEQQNRRPESKPLQVRNSLLSYGINCLSYGVSCLLYDKEWKQCYEVTLAIHEEYINILHLIIGRRSSYLLKLNEVKSIADVDFSISSELAAQKLEFYIVVSMVSHHEIVLAFRTEKEKNVMLLGLKFFLSEGRSYYSKISEFDPFKAECMMLFLEADKDGGNLLDIEEILSILGDLKISREKLDVENDILEINQYLYEKENLKRPNKASNYELIPFAFEYLLRFYSIKQQLAKYFKDYCPIFKVKVKNHKNTIVDVIKSHQQPLMSAVQLSLFYSEIQAEQKTEQYLQTLIQNFPVYDNEGKQSLEDSHLLSFNNFCNLLFGSTNSIIAKPSQSQPFQYETLQNSGQNKENSHSKETSRDLFAKKNYLQYPLHDYFIYYDNSFKGTKQKDKANPLNSALKRGCKCVKLHIYDSAGSKGSDSASQPVVKFNSVSKEEFSLEESFKSIKNSAFTKNKLPFFIILEINCKQKACLAIDELVEEVFQDSVFVPSRKQALVPYPSEIQGKFILVSSINFKTPLKMKINETKAQTALTQLPDKLQKKIVINSVRLDFQRKGQTVWDGCFPSEDQFVNYEQAEELNITNYAKKLFMFSSAKAESTSTLDPSALMRVGTQFIGLNYEKNKENNYFLHSKFMETPEQYFGYLLKPLHLQSENRAPLYSNKDFTKPVFSMKFNLLSGQKIIINELHSTTSFYFQVSLKGSIHDQTKNKTFKSKKLTVGFYSEINLECEFSVYCQELATVVINVKNEHEKVVSSRSASIAKMREGLRSLSLLGERMQKGENSSLLILYKKDQIREQKTRRMMDFLK